MDLGLAGKRALVTGASRGIGLATAACLAQEGAALGLCARGQDRLDQTVAELAKTGAQIAARPLDLGAGAAAIGAWVQDIATSLGGIDILISNVSGGAQAGEAGWRANFSVDLMGFVHLVEAALPSLAKGRDPAIVAVASIAALEEFGGPQPYNALKAALIAHAADLSQALAPHGVRVNTVSPGVTVAPDGPWDQLRRARPDLYQAQAAQVPLGKRFAEAEEIARVICFAASPAASYMTGANLVVDGGLTRRVQY
ncbi:MAG: SDR family NAD(P)-dependent oxidoreductase [Rhodothalassiaceae bacterium]